MSFNYDSSNIGTSTASQRLNAVRLLVGDTNSGDQQLQDEEISFALGQSGNNIYYAAAWSARTISSKFARQVNIDVDGQISADYSDLSQQYASLADRLEFQGKKTSGSMGMVAGGLSRTEVDAVRSNTDRVKPAFNRDQFNNPPNDDTFDYYQD